MFGKDKSSDESKKTIKLFKKRDKSPQTDQTGKPEPVPELDELLFREVNGDARQQAEPPQQYNDAPPQFSAAPPRFGQTGYMQPPPDYPMEQEGSDDFDADITFSPQSREQRRSKLERFFNEHIEAESSEPIDPEKESIFYLGLPDDPPREPEPIHVDGVPVVESPVRLRYKKRNRKPLPVVMKTALTVIGVLAAFGLVMLIIWIAAT